MHKIKHFLKVVMLDQGIACVSLVLANSIPSNDKIKGFLNSFGISLSVSSLFQLYKDVYKPLKELDEKKG